MSDDTVIRMPVRAWTEHRIKLDEVFSSYNGTTTTVQIFCRLLSKKINAFLPVLSIVEVGCVRLACEECALYNEENLAAWANSKDLNLHYSPVQE